MRSEKGFTLVETLVVITMLGIIAAIMMGIVNYSDRVARNNAEKITTDLASIESAFSNYYSDKGSYPTGLADSTFVPIYLFAPQAPTNFDTSYGTTGYTLGLQTGQSSPNNGYYVCTKVTVSGAADTNWLAAGFIGSRLSPQKFFYNTSCPATSNMAAPTGSTTIYYTSWITRY